MENYHYQENSWMTPAERAGEVNELMETLRNKGNFQGKKGQFVLYKAKKSSSKFELIKIVPKNELTDAIVENDDVVGYEIIQFE